MSRDVCWLATAPDFTHRSNPNEHNITMFSLFLSLRHEITLETADNATLKAPRYAL